MECIRVPKVEGVSYLATVYPAPSTSASPPPREQEGTLLITPHHLCFTTATAEDENWIPHSVIQSLVISPPSVTSLSPVTARTFNFETHTFLFSDARVAQDVFDSVKAIITTASLPSSLAFCKTDKATDHTRSKRGWDIYDPKKELARMGAGGAQQRTDAWRWSDVNLDYQFCSTYPAHIAVPSRISDVTLRYGKTYRSKHRIPALVYLHRANLGSITRASQPMVGIKNARSIQDEKLIEAIFHSHAQHSTAAAKPHMAIYGARATNLIIDARPTTNAMANVAKGAGTENMEYYKDCKKAYLGVDNIHVMRDSLKALTEVLRDAEVTGVIDRTALRRSGWLKHVSALLDGSVLIVKNVHLANSHVLVHCSDGWDRTSQLSSLAQICLDPYYRTIEGFAILVEKDWVSFGHKFADRAGHFVKDRAQFVVSAGDAQSTQQALLANVQRAFHGGSHAYKETSPVFHQYLDCVYQILRQFPQRFEFDERLLLKLQYHLYSCEYGTFLYNSEVDRNSDVLDPRKSTESVWDLFLDVNRPWYLNEQYDPSLDQPGHAHADLGVLFPDPRDVKFWPALLRRSEDELNGMYGAESEDPPQPELVGLVDDASGDPVVHAVNGISRSKSPLPRSGSMLVHGSPKSNTVALPASPSDSYLASRLSPNAAPQLQNAYASVMRFGGTTFKTLRRGYEEVVKDFNNATAGASSEKLGETRSESPMPLPASNPWATADHIVPEQKEQQHVAAPPKEDTTAGILEGRHNPWAIETRPVEADGQSASPGVRSRMEQLELGNTDPLGVGLS